MSTLKATSYEYGRSYQAVQAEKYRNRATNHWKHRIALAEKLVADHALPRFRGGNKPINVVDIGCSIGTYAIEFAKKGYRTFGIDFDDSALEIARQLAEEEGVSPEFVCGDVAEWSDRYPEIDIAICFDIFEHLHDDELGAFLGAVRRQLSPQGCLVFHTFPTQYDYIFFSRLRLPLVPLAYLLPEGAFRIATRIYASLVDAAMLLRRGVTHQESIKAISHCNPTTPERLRDIFGRAGYELKVLESANLYEAGGTLSARYRNQPIRHRNIFGVACAKSPAGSGTH